MNSSIVLLSGGLDSIVNLTAAWDEAGKNPDAVRALTFDYGQHKNLMEAEIDAASSALRALHTKLLDTHRVVQIPLYAFILADASHAFHEDSNLVYAYTDRVELEGQDAETILDEAWVPGRNLVFLALGMAYAEHLGFDQVVIGINAQEGETFPDNRQPFLDKVTAISRYSSRRPIKVRSYTEAMNKEMIVTVGLEIGAPIEHLMSCYVPTEQGLNCGRCQSCVRVKAALADAKVPMGHALWGRFAE